MIYSINQNGIGRIVFNEEHTKFQGLLMGDDGECLSLRGSLSAETDIPSTSVMTVQVIDDETGDQLQVEDVIVEFVANPNPISSQPFVNINSDSVKFTTTEVFHGNRADVEIQKYMDPRMVESGSTVHVGRMNVHLVTSHRNKPGMRRESVCDHVNPAILEISDDFLA